jgi:membrane dipeptidase
LRSSFLSRQMPIIIDSHEDIAMNMLAFKRDYTLPVAETRQSEIGSRIPEIGFGDTLLGWPEYQAGRVAVIFATLFAAPQRYEKDPLYSLAYLTVEEARATYLKQLHIYKNLFDEHPDKFQQVDDQKSLEIVISAWQESGLIESQPAIGLVLLMEGAEGIRSPGELEFWWENGLRLIGPAWAGNQYCGGTLEPGPLTTAGRKLLAQMDDLGFTLDISHMDEQSVLQAFDRYQGPIIASHANAQALLHGKSNRFLSELVIRELVSRDGVIGIIPYNHHLIWDWNYPDDKHAVKLDAVVVQIDHICQLAGDAQHVGIGSDFDGGIGMQSTPSEIDTIADLQKLKPLLELKGFTNQDVENIMGGNWLHQLERSLP